MSFLAARRPALIHDDGAERETAAARAGLRVSLGYAGGVHELASEGDSEDNVSGDHRVGG